MATSWIEIADTAIKIGLGALLSGVAAFSLSSLNHKKGLEKEYILKHRSMLEDVSTKIENMTNSLLKHWSAIGDWVKTKEEGKEVSEEKRLLVTKCRQDVFEKFEGLTNSEGKLLLIGCSEQQGQLRIYGEAISDFYRYASRNNEQIKSSGLDIRKESLHQLRKELYISLNTAYKNVKM